MIVAAKELPLSPHESSNKPTGYFEGLLSMASKDQRIAEQEHKQEESGSDDSDASDPSSEEFKLLTLDPETPKETTSKTPAPVAEAAPPAKRVLRRKRKRMSEDERRIRHREVQRQFMKRKRARLGELRKTIRGLEAQHRLAQAMHEREKLEKQNTEFKELLAGPGSGWHWDDAPPRDEQTKIESNPDPMVAQFGPEHGIMAPHGSSLQNHFYPLQYVGAPFDASFVQGHHQPHPLVLHPMEPASLDAHHAVAHRSATSGAPMPWDDILDAVTGDFTF